MDLNLIYQINEAYRHGVYAEETLSEEEMLSIEGWVSQLISEGYDLDDYSDEELYGAYLEELYQGRHGQSDSQYMAGRSDAGKRISGDEKTGPRNYTLGRARGAALDSPTQPGARPVNTPKMTSSERRQLPYDKSESKRRSAAGYNKVGGPKGLPEELDLYDIVSDYLVSEGFCDSYEDADVIMANMSEEWRESIMEEVLDEVNRPEREMIKKGLLKPGRQVARIRNLNRQSGNTNWYAADPRDTRAIKSPGKGGKQRQEQEADAFNTSRRRMEHEFDQDSSRARKTGDWNKVDKKRPLGGHKTRFEKERDERNNRRVYGD
jgi:hypothetical protein